MVVVSGPLADAAGSLAAGVMVGLVGLATAALATAALATVKVAVADSLPVDVMVSRQVVVEGSQAVDVTASLVASESVAASAAVMASLLVDVVGSRAVAATVNRVASAVDLVMVTGRVASEVAEAGSAVAPATDRGREEDSSLVEEAVVGQVGVEGSLAVGVTAISVADRAMVIDRVTVIVMEALGAVSVDVGEVEAGTHLVRGSHLVIGMEGIDLEGIDRVGVEVGGVE